MNINDLLPNEEQEDLGAFAVEDYNEIETPIPEASTTNKAAISALISGSEDLVGTYRAIVDEQRLGYGLTANSIETTSQGDYLSSLQTHGVMPILADPTVGLEEKQAAIKALQNQGAKDTFELFAEESAISSSIEDAPSAEEVRSVDLFEETVSSMKRQQAIINAVKLEMKENSTLTGEVAGIAQEFIPLGEGVHAVKIRNVMMESLGQDPTMGDYLKSFFRPGASIEDMRQVFYGMSPLQQEKFVKAFTEYVKTGPGIIASTDSQMVALSQMDKILGDYGSFEATWDSFVQVLDVVGVGMLVRGATRASKAVDTATKGKTLPEPSKTSNDALKDYVGVPETIDVKVNPEKVKLEGLYEQKAALLADTSGVLPKGTVKSIEEELKALDQAAQSMRQERDRLSTELQKRNRITRKEAQALANKEVGKALDDISSSRTRLLNMLSENAKGAKSEAKLAGIEKEISRIEKLPDSDKVMRRNPIIDGLYRARRNAINENPASPGSIFMKTNPTRARSAYAAAVADETGEVAKALFGMSRQEAALLPVVPRITSTTHSTNAVPVGITDKLDSTISSLLDKSDLRGLTKEEINKGAALKVEQFRNPTNIRPVDGMDTVRFDEETLDLVVSSNYSANNRPYPTAEEAVLAVKREFANHGDVEVIPMKKVGQDYVPVSLESAKGVKGEYVGRIDARLPVTRQDVLAATPLQEMKKRWNFLDRVPAFMTNSSGSLSRLLFTSGMLFDKRATSAANMAEGLSNKLEKVLHQEALAIAKGVGKLSKEQRKQLTDYWLLANEQGIKLDPISLLNQGFTDKMVDLAKDWRRYQDQLYRLENRDLVKTLQKDGYMIMDREEDRFFARPLRKDITEAKGYDPDTGEVVYMTKRKDLDDLYDSGGYWAELRTPFKMEDGTDVSNILVRNKGDNYLRKLEENDVVLNYREGYFHISYDAPYFIDRIETINGVAKTTTVATARDAEQAKAFVGNKTLDDPDAKYVFRLDKRKGQGERSDIWDLNNSGGRITQRRRGKALVEAEGNNRLEGSANVRGPHESALRAATSVAGRAFYRDLLDNMKERFLQNYGDMFTVNGVTKFPDDISKVMEKGMPYSSRTADARTEYEYIRYLENGYVNSLDNLSTSLLSVAATSYGEKAGTLLYKSPIERMLHKAADVGVTGLVKGAVFTNMIVTNVLRQLIVQPAQLIRLTAYDVQGVPNAIRLSTEFASKAATGKALSKEGEDFYKWAESLGVVDSISKSNLVRNTLLDSGEKATIWGKTGGKVVRGLRKVGYDFGEGINMVGHMASVYNKYKREGKNVNNPFVKEEMMGKIRALSYDMSFEGDMPYNQNSLSIITQFMQIPHKAVLNAADRRLTPKEKVRMFVGDMALYGPIFYGAFRDQINNIFGEDLLNKDPELTNALTDGVVSMAMNAALTEIFDEDINLDWEDLSPYEFAGYAKMLEELLSDGGVMAALSRVPAGALFLRDGNRFGVAINSIGRQLGFGDVSEENPQEIGDTLKDLARITSGFTNAEAAYLAYTTQKIMNKSGQTMVEGVPLPVAIAKVFGINPKEVGEFYKDAEQIRSDHKAFEEATRKAAKAAIQNVVRNTGKSLAEDDNIAKVNSILMATASDSPEAMQIWNDEIKYALRDPNLGLTNQLMRNFFNKDIINRTDILERRLGPESQAAIEEFYSSIKTLRGN